VPGSQGIPSFIFDGLRGPTRGRTTHISPACSAGRRQAGARFLRADAVAGAPDAGGIGNRVVRPVGWKGRQKRCSGSTQGLSRQRLRPNRRHGRSPQPVMGMGRPVASGFPVSTTGWSPLLSPRSAYCARLRSLSRTRWIWSTDRLYDRNMIAAANVLTSCRMAMPVRVVMLPIYMDRSATWASTWRDCWCQAP
jgi:hypothetical protein